MLLTVKRVSDRGGKGIAVDARTWLVCLKLTPGHNVIATLDNCTDHATIEMETQPDEERSAAGKVFPLIFAEQDPQRLVTGVPATTSRLFPAEEESSHCHANDESGTEAE